MKCFNAPTAPRNATKLSVAVSHAIALGIFGALSVSFASAAAAPTADVTQMRHAFDIPAQDLESALQAVVLAGNGKVLYRRELLEGARSSSLKGEYTTEEAVQLLLSGTNLTYEMTSTSVVLIRSKDDKFGVSLYDSGIRLAQTIADTPTQESTAADDESAALEEILVTAQRREESLQDVPISITVLSGKQLDASTASGVADALRSVPGLDMGVPQYTGGSVQYIVRGVSNPTSRAGGAGPIAYYLDGVPYGFIRSAYYPDPGVYDLDQIEFLSGPQGTLYGAGSLNGVLRIMTHDAGVDDFELKLRTSASMTDDGENNYSGDAAINVPLIKGVLGARAVVGFRDDSGWIDAPNKSDVNDDELHNYRLRLGYQPTETLSIGLSVWRSEEEIGAPSLSLNNRTITSVRDQSQFNEFTSYALSIEQEFSSFTLASTTSYVDFQNGGIVDGTPSGAQAVLFGDWTSNVFAQELNLVSNLEGSWRWSGGVFYRDAEETVYQDLVAHTGAVTNNNNYADFSESYAVYGEIGRGLTDTLELSAGLRYFHDDGTTRVNRTYAGVAGTFLAGNEFESTSEATTPRAVLTWKPSDAQTFYASYSQGFRSGFAQQPNVQRLFPYPAAEPDRLTNYEMGNKGSLLGGRLSYEAAFFYIDWQDVQQTFRITLPVINLTTTATINGESASGIGASFSLTARPFQGFEFGVNAGWNDLTADADITPPGLAPIVLKGERLISSPEYTAGLNGEYEWSIGGGYGAAIALTGSYKSPQSQPNTLQGVTEKSDDFLIAGATFSIEASANWAARLFVDNMSDEKGTTDRGGAVPEWAPRVRPRTYGVQFEYRFGRQ